MKNIMFWITLVILVLGLGCLHVRYTRGSNENGNPVNLPFPGAGLVVAYPFYIENGGRFEVRLIVPIADAYNSVGMPPTPPNPKSKLKITIDSFDGEKEFRNTQYIEEFRHIGGGRFLRTYFFTGATIELPQKGDYSIEIMNEDYDEVFENCSKTGGMIQLRRDEKLPEAGLFYALLCVLGYGLISISIVGMVIIKVLENLKK